MNIITNKMSNVNDLAILGKISLASRQNVGYQIVIGFLACSRYSTSWFENRVDPVIAATASSIVAVFGSSSVTTCPRRRTTIRSATWKTLGMLWLMKTTGMPGIPHLPDQIENHGRLRDAKGGCRLIHDDDLARPHHRSGHRYSLPLSAGERHQSALEVGHLDPESRQVARLSPSACDGYPESRQVPASPFCRRSLPKKMFATASRCGATARSW